MGIIPQIKTTVQLVQPDVKTIPNLRVYWSITNLVHIIDATQVY